MQVHGLGPLVTLNVTPEGAFETSTMMPYDSADPSSWKRSVILQHLQMTDSSKHAADLQDSQHWKPCRDSEGGFKVTKDDGAHDEYEDYDENTATRRKYGAHGNEYDE